MNKPVLVVMAAGMGSRYGGMKQIDPVGPCGQVIVDYSLYDARRAGFETVIFVIKHEIEEAFKAAIGNRVSRVMDVKYAFQQLDELPEGYTIPEGRVKPWGTCHAVLAAKPYIHGPSPSSMPTTTTALRRSRSSTITSPLTPTARSTTTAW